MTDLLTNAAGFAFGALVGKAIFGAVDYLTRKGDRP